jgi:mannose-6-phosphate isomerase-like protein (cupin superfamily)
MTKIRTVKHMKGYKTEIEKETLSNNDFRRVLYTGKYSQLVLMTLKPGEEIGIETHDTIDQFFRFEEGEGKVIIDGNEYKVIDGDAAIVPSGSRHNVINTSKTKQLKLYTIYSPPEHIDKTIRHTKAEAVADPEEFDGKTTE